MDILKLTEPLNIRSSPAFRPDACGAAATYYGQFLVTAKYPGSGRALRPYNRLTSIDHPHAALRGESGSRFSRQSRGQLVADAGPRALLVAV
jgi:hypothetical protein